MRDDAPIQIHLSTAVCAMFIAGGMLWLNINFHELKDFDFRMQSQTFSSTIFERGWPLGFYRFTQDGDFSRWNILRLAFDIFVCGSIVMLSAMMLESAATRRAADPETHS